jgi:Tol biopolymer transport system component
VNGVSRPGIVVRDDWWRVDIRTGKVEQILSPGEGGGFTFSSNGQYAALVVPGRYDERDGEVELFDLTAGDKREVFSFPAVSTGANYAFYPQIFWEADSLALRLVIPDKDLVYDDSTRPSVLWQVSVEGSVQQLGAVIASFYGLPQWSADGQFIAYIRRTEGENNQLELILARGDGNEAVVYASGEVGALGEPRWLPDANLFVYERGQPGMYWLGQPGEPPVPFLGLLYAPEFLADGWYVYMTEERELRYAQIGGSDSTLITVLGDSYLVFDVALAFNHPTR